MRQTEILRVRKQNVPVELALADTPPRPVEIFLAEHQAHEFRRQHVLDLLEGGPAFLPARDTATGMWEIFNKEALLWIRVPLGPLGDSDATESEELFDFRSRVRIELHGGPALEGELLYSAPEEASRPVDYLNEASRFFRLWDTEHLYLVNRSFVLRVIEL
jgi:hypothetical protein